ncbi:N-acetylmuramoyl-L-alanine amidase family protein [Flagellimonas flava]|uniref:N-acetylmuramoyl-L-alanine amidase family protein n=1 Tax=Flagellimonas flava TaxID=570519 RepID=UPI003D645E26
MKLKNVRFGILLLKTCLIFGWNLSAQNRIVIDPGHGGKDSGAIGQKNAIEKDIVLLVAEEIVKLNKVVFNDRLDIYLTRYTDTLIRLSDRSKLAKAIEADVFISLHCNHAPNSNAKGIEVYVASGDYEYGNESVYLGYELQRQFKEKLGFRSRGVKFANFQVVRETTNAMPSVLVELGFLSNLDESNHYQKLESYRALALVLLESLIQNLDSYERVGD